MVVVQDDIPLESTCSVVSYNLNSTMMASAEGAALDIYSRTSSDLLWQSTARTAALVQPRLAAGETIVQLAWAHPQYGLVLAAGTSYGHVLLLAAGQKLDTPPDGADAAPSLVDSHTWSVLDVLLDEPSRRRSPVTSLVFSPPAVGIVLGAASADGCTRLLQCSVQHPLLPYAKWSCAHNLKPPAPRPAMPGTPASAAKPCTCLSWQPQADPTDACLVLCSETAASVWLYDSAIMDWVCTCPDLEAAGGCSGLTGRVAGVAWAPLVGRSKETIAVARGSAVRVFGLQGNLLNPTVEQIGDKLVASGTVWKMDWNCFGFEVAVSCEEEGSSPASVYLWRMSIEGVFEPKPVAVIQAGEAADQMDT